MAVAVAVAVAAAQAAGANQTHPLQRAGKQVTQAPWKRTPQTMGGGAQSIVRGFAF